MEYKKAIDALVTYTETKADERNRELYEYSKKRFEEFKDKTLFEQLKSENDSRNTGLPGLRVFFYDAGEMIESNPDSKFGVITMDISQFKAVNEFCGRKAGDEMLSHISDIFMDYEKNRPFTRSCHARADNFLMCTSFMDENELIEIVEDIYYKIISFPFPYKVSPSFGICPAYEKKPSVSFLKDCATIAMNNIKGKFYAKYALFDHSMRREILREKKVENDIINALEREELKLYIQPKVDMNTGEIYGGESLIRWEHNEMGMIFPGDFIPILEKNGFIIQIDYFVWEQVFKFLSNLKKKGRRLYPISVNISRVHVHDDDLCDKLVSLCKKYDVEPKYVPLEVTESAFEIGENIMFDNMDYLRTQGFMISMDDFGTGYSSLQMLSSRALDEIKIDRSFVLGLENKKGRIVMEHIVDMIDKLGISFIVEGIETKEQKELMLNYGCNKAQGYLFYKPMPIESFDALIMEKEND